MTFEELTLAGVNVPELLKRLMGNEKLVSMFIKKFLEDKNFAGLTEAIASGDAKQAEITSHTLKGMCGNLSVTRLYQLFTEQVRLIREGDMLSATAMMDEITEEYNKTAEHMRMWLALQD